MAFIPSFTAEQLYATPTILRVTDTSTGNDAEILGRRIYIRKSDGTYLVPLGITTDYISWELDEGDIIELNVLNIDYSTEIRVVWGDDSDLYTIRTTIDGNIRTTIDGNIRVLQ